MTQYFKRLIKKQQDNDEEKNVIITQPLHLYPQNSQNTYILSRKLCKQFKRKYHLIKILIFIGKIIYKNNLQQKIWGTRLKKIFLKTKHKK